MPYRNVFIANKAIMRLKNSQLIVDNESDEFSFPIEDIKSIVIDNQYSTMSAKLLAELADNSVCVIICDSKHMPCLQLLPIASYCRQNKRINLQYEQSQPKLKRIWQNIIEEKIKNQARCLQLNAFSESEQLFAISKTVKSGDSTNREAYAASLYFKALFGKDFKRNNDCEINAALNYGYAIIRSFIAKTIVCEGLEPSLGIHHKNQLNSFNLADDIIEPFRPIIDNFVYNNYKDWGEQFYTFQKAQLQLLLNAKTLVNGNFCSVSRAVELMVQSIISSFDGNEIFIKTPELVDIAYFNYD